VVDQVVVCGCTPKCHIEAYLGREHSSVLHTGPRMPCIATGSFGSATGDHRCHARGMLCSRLAIIRSLASTLSQALPKQFLTIATARQGSEASLLGVASDARLTLSVPDAVIERLELSCTPHSSFLQYEVALSIQIRAISILVPVMLPAAGYRRH
jgi:hypothetical protein